MKYMVMECHPGYAVVLDEDGNFLKVANMRYEIGETITRIFPIKKNFSDKIRLIQTFGAVAACLLLTAGIWIAGMIPYGSVYMSINPEVRIDVNRRNMAVGVHGVNADGKELVNGYSCRQKHLDTVMAELVDLAVAKGYLYGGGEIVLTLEADNTGWIVDTENTLTQTMQHIVSDALSVTVSIDNVVVAAPPSPEIEFSETFPSYQITDYGETDAGTAIDGMTDYSVPAYKNSDSDYGDSDYAPPSPYDDSDYGNSDYEDIDD